MTTELEFTGIGDGSMFTTKRIITYVLLLIFVGIFSGLSVVQAGSINISWDANSETDLSGYQIRYGLSSSDLTKIVNTGKNTEHEFTNLEQGKTYYFVVVAIDYSGNVSDPSEMVSAKMPETPGGGGGDPQPTAFFNKIAGQHLVLPAISFVAKQGIGSIRDSLYFFWDNGSIIWNVHFDSSATYYFGFLAKTNELIDQEWSQLEVRLDDVPLEVLAVDSLEFKYFSRVYDIPEGMHELRISFLNDIFRPGSGQDRNLIVDYLEITDFAVSQSGEDKEDEDEEDTGGDDEEDTTEITKVFKLRQNYPNPFNPSTTIAFELGHKSYIQLSIFNVVGQRIKTIYAGELAAGGHDFKWNARNDFGQQISSGVYFYLLEALSVENFEGELALKSAQRETRTMTYTR
ncbi:MAG: hypothetical protein DWQ05_04105 [Calditrichaeota bacterium]|nr:MAG: hypothetical protein DWQ05_04105 [Calditrichota bacterium]